MSENKSVIQIQGTGRLQEQRASGESYSKRGHGPKQELAEEPSIGVASLLQLAQRLPGPLPRRLGVGSVNPGEDTWSREAGTESATSHLILLPIT